jgi:two-component system chemotaxis sensor kinase CheA
MSKTAEKVIPLLNKFIDNLDSYSLNDREAWQNLASDVSSVVQDIPKQMKPLAALLDFCHQGVNAIAAKTLTDYLAAIDAIAEGFTAAEHYLNNGADRQVLSQKAQDRIAALVQTSPLPEESTPAGAGDGAAVSVTIDSIDDIAAILMQADADSRDDLAAIGAALENLVEARAYDDEACEYLSKAVALVNERLVSSTPPDEALVDAVGGLIENAMQTILEGQKQPVTRALKNEGTDIDADASNFETDATAALRDENQSADGPEAEEMADTEEQNQPLMESEIPEAADDSDYMPEEPDFELIGEFLDEGNDLIYKAEEALLRLETDPEDMDAVGMVFRAFHTVKGTSAFLELAIIADMGHHAESLLSRVRDREIRYSGGYADLSLRALDMLKELINRVQDALGGGPLLKPEGYNELMKILSDPEAAGISEEHEDAPPPRIGDMLVAQGKVSREDVEQAIDSPRVGDIMVARGTATRETIESAATGSSDAPLGLKMVKTQKASVKDVGQALRTQKRMKNSQAVMDTSVRVSTSRLDRLIDMVGELVIAHSMVAQDELVTRGENHDLIKKIGHTSKIVRELQDMSMSLRMVPLKGTFNKMTRLVRDVARKLGKQVNLVTEGEETEIDRNLVDIINDPLVHMIRNAVDHGIEMPDDRLESGKPEMGEVKLSAYHSAGNVVVEIQDNGKGLDKDVILKKAIENGLISEGANLSDREIFNLIFEPGFSTAAEVTDVSGRGVGMDVVKKNIESLRGQVEINSVKGVGSTFKMSLPLTLAIIDGMVVQVGCETYVIPTVSIVKSIKPENQEISTVYGKGEMISVQGKLIPLVRMADLYELEVDPQHEANRLVVIVEDEHHQAGLVIHELLGRQQVVIKTLGETMRNIPGISGSAIMPNGRVGLIIDVGGLLKYANQDSPENGSAEKRAADASLAMVA